MPSETDYSIAREKILAAIEAVAIREEDDDLRDRSISDARAQAVRDLGRLFSEVAR